MGVHDDEFKALLKDFETEKGESVVPKGMLNYDRMKARFLEYIQIDSETGNEKAMMERLLADIRALGYEPETDENGEKCGSNGSSIYFKVPGGKGEPLLFSAHMDTVVPGVGIEPIEKDGVIYSVGNTILGADDKAGICEILEALQTIEERAIPHRPIEVMFSVREEAGLYGAKYMDMSKITAKRAVIMDAGGEVQRVFTSAPGQNQLKAEITGKASHAGSCPEKGVSAIMAGAEAISNMKLLRIDEETTANIGTFRAEGPTNIVNNHAEIVAEIRSRNEEKLARQTSHMITCLEEACYRYGAELKTEVTATYPSFHLSDHCPTVELVAKCLERMGMEMEIVPCGGGSDANYMNSYGMEAVVLSAGMYNAHTYEEKLSLKDFRNAANLVFELMKA